MSPKLIIVADLQHFKLFSVEQSVEGTEFVKFIEGSDSLDIHQRLSEKVSDRKGNFQSIFGSGSGENHNIGLEEERRRIKEIASQIYLVLQRYPHESWYFAAPKAINSQIIDLVNTTVKESMTINLHTDLTNIPNNQLLEYFSK